jgi:hypothetical protein
MKKILLIGIFFTIALCANAQVKTAEYSTFYLNPGDSVVIEKKDKIAAIAWSIPADATDSIQVFGGKRGFLGKAPEPIAYRAGESSSLGYDDRTCIKDAKIKAYTRTRITVVPVRD